MSRYTKNSYVDEFCLGYVLRLIRYEVGIGTRETCATLSIELQDLIDLEEAKKVFPLDRYSAYANLLGYQLSAVAKKAEKILMGKRSLLTLNNCYELTQMTEYSIKGEVK